MKSTLIKAFRAFVVFAAASIIGHAHAQIPVTDVAQITTHVSNQVETIVKWGMQFQQLKQQIDQAKQQFESMNGARGMAQLLDNAGLKNVLPPEWQTILENVKKTSTYINERNQWPVLPNMPNTNAMYDTIASQNAVMTDLYKTSNERLKQVQQLMAQIDNAADPAAKQDLANRLVSEQNAIQANQNLVTVLQAKQKQELEAASSKAAKEFKCSEFKTSGC